MTNYNSRRNNNNKVLKTFKDYLFPIVVVIIILLLIGNYLFSWNNSSTETVINSSLEVSLGMPDTEAYSVYSGWNKTKLEWKILMYKTEKLQVVNGSLNIKDVNSELVLNKLWELRYNEDGGYTLYSSDLWVKSSSGIHIEMRYAKVSSMNQSVFSLSQNEVASTIYVVSWILNVENLAGKSATLQKWEKLVIMRNNAKDENSDLSLSKEPIDDYIKSDDWFIKNNGSSYLSAIDTVSATGSMNASGETLTGAVLLWTWGVTQSDYITFNNLYDEAEINAPTVDIEGTILSDMVFKIDINWQIASIDNNTKTFLLKWFKLNAKTNDLVYRVYDEWNKLLDKRVLTIYSTSSTDLWNNTNSTLAQVENYPITSSPLYQILTPKQNPYTTSDNKVRIEWLVPAWVIERIVVNDFQLRKFPKYWTYWTYFADYANDNLKEWVNIYKIQYFGTEWKLIYENNFTIIKEVKKVEASSWVSVLTDPIVESATWVIQ